jgi:hypothetical protein
MVMMKKLTKKNYDIIKSIDALIEGLIISFR